MWWQMVYKEPVGRLIRLLTRREYLAKLLQNREKSCVCVCVCVCVSVLKIVIVL